MNYKISDLLLNFIKKFEGFSPKIYICEGGCKTIGFGHVLKENEIFGYITQEEATEILKKDIMIVINGIKSHITNNYLTEKQYIALISLTFNIGIEAFKKSTLLEKLNNNKILEVIEEFKKWVRAKGKILTGLVKRRSEEAELFAANIA